MRAFVPAAAYGREIRSAQTVEQDPECFGSRGVVTFGSAGFVVISDRSALPPIDIAEMFVTKKWPFVNNCELWWPSDELAARYRKILPAALRCYFVSLANQRVAETHLGYKIENAEVVP